MTAVRTGSPSLLRELNRSAVLSLIGREGPIARHEIARRLAVSPATVTAVTRDLVDEGLVRVVEKVSSRTGRPALRLALVPDAARVVGVKIAPDRLAAVAVDLDGEVIDSLERPLDTSPNAVVDEVADALRPLVDAPGLPAVLGLGLGVPGIVDGGRVVNAPLLGWQQLPLHARMEEALGHPVLVDNDVNTLAIAERLYGRGRDAEDFLTITLGRGIGLGIVAGGEVYRGAHGGAGEFGHLTVADGPECTCGKRGCLEAVAADPSLLRAAHASGLLGPDATIDDLRALADAGDAAALRIHEAAGEVVGRAVAGLVNVLDPRLVIVSGEGVAGWRHLDGSFHTALHAHTFPPLRGVPVVIDPWDDAKWARGAAALVLRAMFAAPGAASADEAIRRRLATGRSVVAAGASA